MTLTFSIRTIILQAKFILDVIRSSQLSKFVQFRYRCLRIRDNVWRAVGTHVSNEPNLQVRNKLRVEVDKRCAT